MGRGKGSAGIGAMSLTALEEQQQPQKVLYNDGIASRVQKRRRPSEFVPVSPEKRIKRERTSSLSGVRRNAEAARAVVEAAVNGGGEVKADSITVPDKGTRQGQDSNGQMLLSHRDMDGMAQEIPLESVESKHQKANPELQDKELHLHPRTIGKDAREDAMGEDEITLFPKPHKKRVIYDDTGGPEPIEDYTDWFRQQGLLTLALLAKQILEIIARCAFSELEDYQQGTIVGAFTKFADIVSLFERVKSSYGLSQPGSHFVRLQFDTEQKEEKLQVQTINTATAILILLQSTDNSLFDVQEYFLDTFMGTDTELQDWQAVLLSDLRSYCFVHGYESAMYTQPDEPYRLARAIEERLKHNNPARPLSMAEESLIGRCVKIETAGRTGDKDIVGQDLDWSRTLFNCLPSLKQLTQRMLRLPISTLEVVADQVVQSEPTAHMDLNGLPTAVEEEVSPENLEEAETSQSHMDDTFDQDEMIRRAALAAHAALTGQPISESYVSSMSYSSFSPPMHQRDSFPTVHQSPYAQNSYAQELQARAASVSSMASQQPQNPTTAEQYERARLAATAKAAAKNKNATPTSSQRRPWTQDEENALMTGLDRVQGPHWSQILAMYGAGGTISEILKDRNQVQLKDKARNLKLFFLKSGLEVPHYLKHVTGELKTRAPLTAAKNEARERLQESAGEHKAADNAINVLVGGRQGYSTSSPPSEQGTPMSGMQGSDYGGRLTPAMDQYEGQYQQHADEQDEDEDDVQDEMMADAIQQALAVGQQTTM